MTRRLDPFETSLLGELRSHVVQGERKRSVTRRPSVRRGLAPAAAAGLVTAGIVAATLVPGLGTQTAFSVTEGNSGEITVRVDRPEDAEGLEAALSEHGVAADVTYLAWPQECAPGRYSAAIGRDTSLAVGDDLLEVTLGPGAVGEGETFVLSIAFRSDGTTNSGITEFDVATGPVSPCRPMVGRG